MFSKLQLIKNLGSDEEDIMDPYNENNFRIIELTG